MKSHHSVRIDLRRFGEGMWEERPDAVAVEEPLELRVDGHPVAVVMRTPGHDEDLVRGFLLTEGVARVDEVRRIEVRARENRALVFLAESARLDLARLSRHLFSGSSCGICGKATLEAVFAESPAIRRPAFPQVDALLASPETLRAGQAGFDSSGGLHAAGIFGLSGGLRVVREDIGRHNAVDKAIGHAAATGLDLTSTFLLVSGRVSFEIMQKALAAEIPCVAAISAPTSLAVDFARRSGHSLVGFLRPPHFNRYA